MGVCSIIMVIGVGVGVGVEVGEESVKAKTNPPARKTAIMIAKTSSQSFSFSPNKDYHLSLYIIQSPTSHLVSSCPYWLLMNLLVASLIASVSSAMFNHLCFPPNYPQLGQT